MVNITTPLRIGYVLFPAFTALDVFGPLNVLNLISITHNMTLSLVSTDLKPVSVDRSIVDGIPGGMLASSASPNFTQFVLPTHTFDTAPDFDVIIVPGGAGSRNINGTKPHVDWLRQRMDDPELDYMMAVCTGTSLLARTGKIAGRNATTNKAAFNWVKTVEHAEDVNWIAKARWVVDGNLWTSSGVSAGTDMTLGWIEKLYGRNESERVRNLMEWNALNQTDDPFAEYYGLV
ncbi:class I glutamine amidotransferase-like protein [Hypoxylon trugodes]|uniref:class I glutamine amidotransferase-like protein n=1 Tax=Hypoxylon trugodes TaxID=326681 RepID=UPI002196A1F9|nr:class I glutamine amidotransferase-like protein [Hypoxylon trugodes]KAI1393033.1 class I glutamine amidotransferase-like protein [Hypoxylon trugodes]